MLAKEARQLGLMQLLRTLLIGAPYTPGWVQAQALCLG